MPTMPRHFEWWPVQPFVHPATLDHWINGNSRILNWRYCTILLAIFSGDIPLHRPYIGLIYGRYLQFRFLSHGHWLDAPNDWIIGGLPALFEKHLGDDPSSRFISHPGERTWNPEPMVRIDNRDSNWSKMVSPEITSFLQRKNRP